MAKSKDEIEAEEKKIHGIFDSLLEDKSVTSLVESLLDDLGSSDKQESFSISFKSVRKLLWVGIKNIGNIIKIATSVDNSLDLRYDLGNELDYYLKVKGGAGEEVAKTALIKKAKEISKKLAPGRISRFLSFFGYKSKKNEVGIIADKILDDLEKNNQQGLEKAQKDLEELTPQLQDFAKIVLQNPKIWEFAKNVLAPRSGKICKILEKVGRIVYKAKKIDSPLSVLSIEDADNLQKFLEADDLGKSAIEIFKKVADPIRKKALPTTFIEHILEGVVENKDISKLFQDNPEFPKNLAKVIVQAIPEAVDKFKDLNLDPKIFDLAEHLDFKDIHSLFKAINIFQDPNSPKEKIGEAVELISKAAFNMLIDPKTGQQSDFAKGLQEKLADKTFANLAVGIITDEVTKPWQELQKKGVQGPANMPPILRDITPENINEVLKAASGFLNMQEESREALTGLIGKISSALQKNESTLELVKEVFKEIAKNEELKKYLEGNKENLSNIIETAIDNVPPKIKNQLKHFGIEDDKLKERLQGFTSELLQLAVDHSGKVATLSEAAIKVDKAKDFVAGYIPESLSKGIISTAAVTTEAVKAMVGPASYVLGKAAGIALGPLKQGPLAKEVIAAAGNVGSDVLNKVVEDPKDVLGIVTTTAKSTAQEVTNRFRKVKGQQEFVNAVIGELGNGKVTPGKSLEEFFDEGLKKIGEDKEIEKLKPLIERKSSEDRSSIFSHLEITGSGEEKAKLSGLTFDSYEFDGTRFTSVSFAGSSLKNCDFKNANLTNVDFAEATIDAITFKSMLPALEKGKVVSLQGAKIVGDLSGVNLSSFNLEGVDLSGVTNMYKEPKHILTLDESYETANIALKIACNLFGEKKMKQAKKSVDEDPNYDSEKHPQVYKDYRKIVGVLEEVFMEMKKGSNKADIFKEIEEREKEIVGGLNARIFRDTTATGLTEVFLAYASGTYQGGLSIKEGSTKYGISEDLKAKLKGVLGKILSPEPTKSEISQEVKAQAEELASRAKSSMVTNVGDASHTTPNPKQKPNQAIKTTNI